MSKNILASLDRFGIFDPRVLLALGVVFGLLAALLGWWNFLEPVIGIATLATVVATWWQNYKAKEAYYEVDDNGDDRYVVAVEMGRPVSEACKAQFGHVDVLVRAEVVVGTNVLTTPEHYAKMAQAVYGACARAQNRPIDLVVSGPVGLQVLVGQLLGLDRFAVRVWQYYNGRYEALPRPTRDWLEHRN